MGPRRDPAATPQPTHHALRPVVSTACSSSPSTSDTARNLKPGSPSMAVLALPSELTWGLLVAS